MRKFISLVAALLVVSFLVVTPSVAADDIIARVGPARNQEWSRTEMPSGPVQDVTLNDPAPCCRLTNDCTPTPDPDFNVGDPPIISNYWEETVLEDAPSWDVEFSSGLKPPGRPVIVLFNRHVLSFGPLPAGTYSFCTSHGFGPIPPEAAGRQDIATGFGVRTPGGTLPPAPYQTFDVNP